MGRVDRCYNCSVSVFVKGNKGWDDVAVVGVVFVRVAVRDERGWILGVTAIGHCVVVCCDCTVDVKVEGAEMTSWGAYAGVVMLCGRGCGDNGCWSGVDDECIVLLGRQCPSSRAKRVGIQGRKPWISWSCSRCRTGRDFASRPRIWIGMVRRMACTNCDFER